MRIISAEAPPRRFARLALVQHDPIGCFQHDTEAAHACGTWRVCDGKFDKPTETRWMVTWRAAAVLKGRWDQVLWALACFRVGTEQTAWEPVIELLVVQALRDAQQPNDASALLLLRSGRGYCSRFRLTFCPCKRRIHRHFFNKPPPSFFRLRFWR